MTEDAEEETESFPVPADELEGDVDERDGEEEDGISEDESQL
ncbi:MAG TPA: hypothetical protein VM818_19460 [Vicinamibacterales bacterium]|nr:hypothetical protein [Vicinamibacterales bacterium]